MERKRGVRLAGVVGIAVVSSFVVIASGEQFANRAFGVDGSFFVTRVPFAQGGGAASEHVRVTIDGKTTVSSAAPAASIASVKPAPLKVAAPAKTGGPACAQQEVVYKPGKWSYALEVGAAKRKVSVEITFTAKGPAAAWVEGKSSQPLGAHAALAGAYATPEGDLVVLELRDEGCFEGEDHVTWVTVEPDEIFAPKPQAPAAATSADPTVDALRFAASDDGREGAFSRRALLAGATFPFVDDVNKKTYADALTARRGIAAGKSGASLTGECRPQRYTSFGKVVIFKRDGKLAQEALLCGECADDAESATELRFRRVAAEWRLAGFGPISKACLAAP